MYNKVILDYFKKLEHAGRVRGANAVGKAFHEKSRDEVHIFMLIDESGKIVQASFRAYGSVLTMATSSLACKLLTGIHIKDVTELSEQSFKNEFGEVDLKFEYVYQLVLDSIYNAVKNYYDKIEKSKKK